jgi:RIO-like serine/threonine protein kinase
MPATPAAILGAVRLLPGPPPVACRDTGEARWWARPASRWLAAREARALRALAGDPAFPELLAWDGRRLLRSRIEGATMAEARPRDPAYFRAALRALAHMHRRGVAHNDLAREPNWLVTPDGGAAIIDFQLAWRDAARGRLFRLMAREDLRHLLKHKRSYCPGRLTARERALLATPSLAARAWRRSLQPLGRALRRLLPPAGGGGDHTET